VIILWELKLLQTNEDIGQKEVIEKQKKEITKEIIKNNKVLTYKHFLYKVFIICSVLAEDFSLIAI
jgi:hypothetical protein